MSRAWLSIRCWAPHNPPSVFPFCRSAGNGDPEVGTVGDSCSVSAQLTHKEAQSHVEVTPLGPGPSSPPPSPLLHLPSAHPIEPPHSPFLSCSGSGLCKEMVTFLRGCPLPAAHRHGEETTAMPSPFSGDMTRAQSKDTATRKLSADHALPCLLFGCAWSIPAAAGCAPPPCTDRRSLSPVGSPV